MWERQLKTVTQRLNRARSAPARTSYYKVPEFSVAQCNTSREKHSGQKLRRPTNVEIDLEYFHRVREKELFLQRQAVKTFLQSIEPLELVPWTPGYQPTENSNEVENNSVVMAAVAQNKQDVNANEVRSRSRSIGSYNIKDSVGLAKHASGNERSVNVINTKVPLNAWT